MSPAIHLLCIEIEGISIARAVGGREREAKFVARSTPVKAADDALWHAWQRDVFAGLGVENV